MWLQDKFFGRSDELSEWRKKYFDQMLDMIAVRPYHVEIREDAKKCLMAFSTKGFTLSPWPLLADSLILAIVIFPWLFKKRFRHKCLITIVCHQRIVTANLSYRTGLTLSLPSLFFTSVSDELSGLIVSVYGGMAEEVRELKNCYANQLIEDMLPSAGTLAYQLYTLFTPIIQVEG